MKSNSLIIFILTITAFFYSCEKMDEYIQPNVFSDAVVYTSQFQNEQYRIGINDFISFSDLSQNATSHTWKIPEGSFFIKGDISNSDTDLDKYIIGDQTESSEKTVHVLFKKGGIYPVRLYNTFNDSVPFAEKVGDIYVLDTTFMVDVYDTIVAQAMIRKDGVEIPFGNDTIYLEAGSFLEFVDLSTVGRPNSRTWQIIGESNTITSTDSVAKIMFRKLGNYTVSFQSSRVGQNMPGDWDDLQIPNPIKVIKSTQPFILYGNIYEEEDQSIKVPFTGEFEPFTNKEEFFTVMVNGVEFPILSVQPDQNDFSTLSIILKDRIYRSDSILISYSGGELISTDGRPAESFENVKVVMHDINMLSEAVYGFEDGGASWSYLEGTAEYEFTTEKAYSGDYSLKIVVSNNDNVKVQCDKGLFDLEEGKTYDIQYKTWIDPSSTGSALNVWMLPTWNPQLLLWIPDIEKGKWVTVKHEYTAGPGRTDQFLMVHPYENGTYYFDDFYLNLQDKRP